MTKTTTETPMNPYDLIKAELNDDDDLHAVIPTERDGDDLYVLTVRVQPAERDDGRVVHIRTILVDLDDESADWQGNGMWLPVTSNLPLELGKALVGTHNLIADGRERDEPLIANGMNGGDDDLARSLLGVEDEEAAPESAQEARDGERPSPGTESYWSDVDEHSGDEEAPERTAEATRTCQDCGTKRPISEMAHLELGGVEYWTCAGECSEEEEADE